MGCKDQCTKPEYEPKKLVKFLETSPYKKCTTCCIYIKWEGLYCPCCSYRLSKRAKNSVMRKRL